MSHRDPVDVLHGVLLALPGGISAAGKAIGRSPGVMHNKFSEAMPHYEVTVREAIALARHAQSTAFAEAVCEQFGGAFLPLPEGNGIKLSETMVGSFADIAGGKSGKGRLL